MNDGEDFELCFTVSAEAAVNLEAQRASLDSIRRLNQMRLAEVRDPEIEARIQSYEMAFKLQSAAPELMNLKQESNETLKLWTRTFGMSDAPHKSWPRANSAAR